MKRWLLGALALVLFGLGGALAQTSAIPPLSVFGLRIDDGVKTVTANAGAATLNKASGKVTSEALTTAAGGVYTLTLTNSTVAAGDLVFASLANGTNTTGSPGVVRVTPGTGTVTIAVRNGDASAALNGTVIVSFMVLKN